MNTEPEDSGTEKTGDLLELCRKGYCSLACLILYEHFGGKVVWGLVAEGAGIAHFFLMKDGRALDIGGFCSLEEMKRIFPGEIHPAKRVTLELVKHMKADAAEPEYLAIVDRRIRAHIEAHPELFQ